MANTSILAAFERMWQHVVVALNGKSDINHIHNYAGSSSAGGSATSAVKLDTSAGSTTQPVYFSGGKPVATTYTLEKSVPSDAKFTDTVYTHPSSHAASMITEDSTHRFMTDTERSKLDAMQTIEIASVEPTNEDVGLWVNPTNEDTVNLPEINDSTISTVDTWSSNKINSELSGLKESIANLPTGDDASIPDYVVEEAEATIEKVFSHGNYGRTIRFIAISDTHEDSAESYNPQITISNQHAGQAIKYIADRIGLDFVAHLGDASSCGAWATTYEPSVLRDDIKNINKFVFSGVRDIKKAFIPGNHDMISLNGYALLNSGAYPLFGNMCSGNKDRLGGWGYFDIDDANVRVIYLNTSDSPSSASYLALSQSQKNWLCETLIDVNEKGNADEWKVILLSHAPLDFGGADISTDILLPYVNGGSYSGYSFAKNSAEIISNIHGHVHCFSYGYIADKIRRFCIPNACFIGANHYASKTEFAQWVDTTTYNKTANTGKDTSFSLVTIDLDSGKCYVDNYGAGIDRVFSTEYKPEVIVVPTSISNITYSGDTTVESAIDKSKFSFTVTYSNGTTSLVTGASTVSPTTISAVGNNSVTITYVEDGTTLTGTTTIVGTPKPIVNLFDKNDADVVDNARFNSSNVVKTDQTAQLVTGYFEAKVGDTFTVQTDRSLKSGTYSCDAMMYTSSKSAIDNLIKETTVWSFSSDNLTGTFTIPATYGTVSFTDTAYVRFSVAYTDKDNIVITKA